MTLHHALAALTLTTVLATGIFAHDLRDPDHPDHRPHYDRSIKPPLTPGFRQAPVIAGMELLDQFSFDSFISVAVLPSDLNLEQQNRIALAIAETFRPFAPSVRVRWDDRYFYVESDGFPSHRMMVGITAWQQQVPIPQSYVGRNAWRFPLVPTVAPDPLSAKDHFFRGAIAIAANGVPIFNPIKNDGRTDTYLAGELDEFGGHAGRADDYHYHIAPLHLQNVVGAGKPLAYALDGYPIYGLNEPDGSKPQKLDSLNGHADSKGYHYHSTKTYPYINGGFHGQVVERDGQVDPQPRADGVRPATEPLRGAVITAFTINADKSVTLTYTLRGETKKIVYMLMSDGSYRFEFIDGDGAGRVERYSADSRRGGGERRNSDGANRDNPRRSREDSDEIRVPWIIQHAAEMDADKDGSLSFAEIRSEISRAFGLYDLDMDGRIDAKEISSANVRSALGGFVRQHKSEIDSNSDGLIMKGELEDTVTRMFERADRDRDRRLSPDETKKATPLERPRRNER